MKTTRPYLWAAMVLLAGSGTCFGQSFTANLTGLVTDPNQAVMPGVTVRIKNIATNDSRQTTSGSEGRYTFSQLLPGTYDVTGEFTGFKITALRGVALASNQSAELNIAMQLGEVTQTVEVAESSVALDTQTANQSVTLPAKQFLELPVSARNPFVMVHLMAGTVSVRTGISTSVQDSSHGRFALNGGRDESAAMLIDGVPATSGDWSALLAVPNTDSIREVQVVRNSYDVQFGKSGGGVVSMVSKGGTNEYHGMGFEFLRNDHLDANPWAQNRAGRARTTFQRSQFGGNFSGPIWKRKNLYIFGGYDGVREGSPAPYLNSVPTELQRRGDFSQTFNANGSLSTIFNPFTTRPNPSGAGFIRDPFPGNRIPDNLFDPVGLKTANFYPAANTAGNSVTGALNYFGSGKSVTKQNRTDIRVDWARNEKHSIYARITKTRFESISPKYFGGGADNGAGSVIPRHHVTIGNTFLPTPTWVINLLVGTGRFREVQISPSLGLDGTKLGFASSLVGQLDANTIPQFNVDGFAIISNSRVLDFPRDTHNLQVNVTKERGAHSIKFGFAAESAHLNSTDSRSADFPFNRGMTSGPVAAANSSTSGNSIASLLLGTGAPGGIAPITMRGASNQMYYAGYVQDAWRINPRLTVNAGIRYEVQKGRTERFDRYNSFDFGATNPLGARVGLPLTGGLVFVTPDNRGVWDTDKSDLAPRVGLSLKLTDKIVARAGYGIFYPQTVGRGPNIGADGFSTVTQFVSTTGGDGINPQDRLSNPFPRGITQPVGRTRGLETLIGETITGWQRAHPTGYIQNYSLDIQYEINRGTVLEVGYAGNQSRKLLMGSIRNVNQLPTQLLSQGAALDRPVTNPFAGVITTGVLSSATIPAHRLLRPYPQFVAVNLPEDTPGASASYNALVAKVTKQFTGGLSLLSSYQWSKAIDNASETQGWELSEAIRDAYNLSADRSISGHDVPHSWVTALVYELPVGKGRKFGAGMSGVADAVLGGWQFSAITRFNVGLPLQVTTGNTLAAYGFNVQRPNIANLKDLDISTRTPERWFNTTALTQPAPFTIGGAPRWIPNLRFDTARYSDFALMKNFRYRERLRIQFRGEFFNVTNTPQFGRADTNLASGSFGSVSGTINPPRNVQAALKIEF